MRRNVMDSVHVQLTREESRLLHELAAMRGQTPPELVRDALRLGPLEEREGAESAPAQRHLRIAPSASATGAAYNPPLVPEET